MTMDVARAALRWAARCDHRCKQARATFVIAQSDYLAHVGDDLARVDANLTGAAADLTKALYQQVQAAELATRAVAAQQQATAQPTGDSPVTLA